MLTLLPLMRSPRVRPKARVSSAHASQTGKAQCGGIEPRTLKYYRPTLGWSHAPFKSPTCQRTPPELRMHTKLHVLISVNKVQLSGLATGSRMSCWPTTPPSSTCQNRAGALGATSRLWADPRGVVYLSIEEENKGKKGGEEKEWRSADRHTLRGQPTPMRTNQPQPMHFRHSKAHTKTTRHKHQAHYICMHLEHPAPP
jgi:hypothetical protein